MNFNPFSHSGFYIPSLLILIPIFIFLVLPVILIGLLIFFLVKLFSQQSKPTSIPYGVYVIVEAQRTYAVNHPPYNGSLQTFVTFVLPMDIRREFWVPEDQVNILTPGTTGVLTFAGQYFHSFVPCPLPPNAADITYSPYNSASVPFTPPVPQAPVPVPSQPVKEEPPLTVSSVPIVIHDAIDISQTPDEDEETFPEIPQDLDESEDIDYVSANVDTALTAASSVIVLPTEEPESDAVQSKKSLEKKAQAISSLLNGEATERPKKKSTKKKSTTSKKKRPATPDETTSAPRKKSSGTSGTKSPTKKKRPAPKATAPLADAEEPTQD